MSGTGWVDIQVNGYAGVDFNSDRLTVDQLLAVCDRLERDGISKILPTIITAPLDSMLNRISNLRRWIEGYPIIAARFAGIHVEGPFINPQTGFVGAHPPIAVLPANLEVAQRIVDAGMGYVRLVTLAPEADPGFSVTKWLASNNIVVAGGHSDATIRQLREAIDAGLKLYTHLGNGCPTLLPRHDNIIQRVLSVADEIAISFIADGHHIPPFVLTNYLRLVPEKNIVVVSDAISAAGLGPGDYELFGQTVHVDHLGAAWSADRKHFAGSASTLLDMRKVLQSIGITDAQIRQWFQENPARLLSICDP